MLFKNGVLIGRTSAGKKERKPSSPLSMTTSNTPCKRSMPAVHSVWTELRVGDVLSVIARPRGASRLSSQLKKRGKKLSRQVSIDEKKERKRKQESRYMRNYRSGRLERTHQGPRETQNPGFILAVENVILTGRDDFYVKDVKQIIDDGEGREWKQQSFHACHWKTATVVTPQYNEQAEKMEGDNDHHDHKSCDNQLPMSYGTGQWEFSKDTRYIWGPDKLAKMVFMRTTIGETCMTPSSVSSSSTNGYPGNTPRDSESTNEQRQRQKGGTILKQMPVAMSVLMISVAGQADVYLNGLLIRRIPPSSCRSVTEINVPHSGAVGTGSFYTGAVIGIHAVARPAPNKHSLVRDATTGSIARDVPPGMDSVHGGIIVAAGPQLAMTGRDPVRVLSQKEITAMGLTTGVGKEQLWNRDQYEACNWHVATALSVFADGNKWCKPDSFATKEWPFPNQARYVWHPDRMERDVFLRITIGGDEDNCAKRMVKSTRRIEKRSEVGGNRQRHENDHSRHSGGFGTAGLREHFKNDAEQEVDVHSEGSDNDIDMTTEKEFMEEDWNMRQYQQSRGIAPSTMSSRSRLANGGPMQARSVITRNWVCSASDTLPVLFSTPGTAKLYVNGRHVATHSDEVTLLRNQGGDACETHSTVYIQANPGTVVTFYVTGAAQSSALGLIASIGGWYVTGRDQRWRMSHGRRAKSWIFRRHDACHDSSEQQMIVTDKIRCKAKTMPAELGAEYVWSVTRSEFLYVRVTIGESCTM